MFPNLSGLQKSVDTNTEVQRQLLVLLRSLNENIVTLNRNIQSSQKAAGTNSSGPR